MAEITASLVKELRDKTGAGMMDCKRALTETAGDLEQAVDWLRKKGLAAAAKKAGFVARNDNFQDFVRRSAEIALAHDGDMSRVQAAEYPGGGSVTDKLTHLV